MNAQQTALMAQFAALETVMSNLQATSNLLTSALANANSSGRRSSSTSSTSVRVYLKFRERVDRLDQLKRLNERLR